MTEETRRGKVYLDTNIFIQAFEADPSKSTHLKAFFEFALEHGEILVTSELTLAEVLAPSRHSRPNNRAFYLNLFDDSGVIDLQPVTRLILIETADLRKTYRLKLPDAIHVVTSLQTECKYFVSADRDTVNLPDSIEYVRPDAASIHNLMEALRA
jgi:predicted nucleic acid-binding protein